MIRVVTLWAVTAIASGLLTAVVMRHALRTRLMDIPNDRSSHHVPTPRGGGLAIAIMMTLGIMLLGWLGVVDAVTASALIIGGGAMVAVGWLDDRRGVSATVRFGAHVAAVLIALAGTAGLGRLELPGLPPINVLQVAAATFALVWLINLFNFMDGIDGIAGAEAVFFSVGLTVCLCLGAAAGSAAIPYAALTGGAALGFLGLNWPPARIFMGDVGSGFLGFHLGVLSLLAHRESGMTVWVPAILLGVFVTDATVTLLRRAARGERWYAAHRSHAYQWLARRHGAHRPVTIGVLGVNCLWLLPMAAVATLFPTHAAFVALVAYLPLVAAALWAGAGRRE